MAPDRTHSPSVSLTLDTATLSDASSGSRPEIPELDHQPFEFRKKDGTPSKMRSHRGNVPVLPQTKLCPHCPAKFTRTTHLNRHLRTHTNERLHRCDTCAAEFTRSDLLTRHKRSCNDPLNPGRSRKKSCQPCSDSKIKCDNKFPCSKCTSRGKDCVFLPNKRNSAHASTSKVSPSFPTAPAPTSSSAHESNPSPSTSTTSLPTPSSLFAATPESCFSNFAINPTPQIHDVDDMLSESDLQSTSIPLDFSFPMSQRYDSSDKPPHPSPSPDFISSDSATDNEHTPINSHLSSMYQSDLFEPFFSTLFSQTQLDSPPNSAGGVTSAGIFPFARRSGSPEFPFSINPAETQQAQAQRHPLDPGMVGATHHSTPYSASDPLSPSASDSDNNGGVGYTLQIAELDHFLYIFFSAFCAQMPIVHPATFKVDGRPQVLLRAMQACGALFVKTKQATSFVNSVLETARDALVQEFAKNPTDCSEQIDFILAVVLLQTIGLFHQKVDQRASSSIYHGMLVMMVRRSNLMSRNTAWIPPRLSESSIEDMWRKWVLHEMTKRALLLSYLHDCCHSIYFALPPSYLPGEVELYLPCEDSLWKAGSSKEWFMLLQSSSPYGDATARLIGQSMPKALSLMTEPRLLSTPIISNPFSLFILVHVMLYQLFTVCMEIRLPKTNIAEDYTEQTNQQVQRLQYGLHNWLQSWLHSPETPRFEGSNEEPPFMSYGLPFYWLGQVALLAYQEGLPPFEHNSTNNLHVEMRFKLVKQWLKHIRGFLKKSDNGPTLFWDELMKIRLDTSRPSGDKNDTGDDQEGLLGFFPEQ
ncbi:Zinc cluster transcription factor 47 [Pleurotus pulmonarius]